MMYDRGRHTPGKTHEPAAETPEPEQKPIQAGGSPVGAPKISTHELTKNTL